MQIFKLWWWIRHSSHIAVHGKHLRCLLKISVSRSNQIVLCWQVSLYTLMLENNYVSVKRKSRKDSDEKTFKRSGKHHNKYWRGTNRQRAVPRVWSPRPAALLSQRPVLEMQMCGPHPRSTESETLRWLQCTPVWEPQPWPLMKNIIEKIRPIHIWSNAVILVRWQCRAENNLVSNIKNS